LQGESGFWRRLVFLDHEVGYRTDLVLSRTDEPFATADHIAVHPDWFTAPPCVGNSKDRCLGFESKLRAEVVGAFGAAGAVLAACQRSA
jgi:hypothetical protein